MKLLLSILLALCILLPLIAAEADPDRLSDAIQAAAKKQNSIPKPAKTNKKGAKPAPQKKPQKDGGLNNINWDKVGLIGGHGIFRPLRDYGAKCQKKNPDMMRAINTFCSHTPLKVPSPWTSNGYCIFNNNRDVKQSCAKIGSKKKGCKSRNITKKVCMRKLREICAKGGKHGGGKSKNEKCAVFETGTIIVGAQNAWKTFYGWSPLRG